MSAESPSGPKGETLSVTLKFPDVATFADRFAGFLERRRILLPGVSARPVGAEIRFQLKLKDGTALIGGEGTVEAMVPAGTIPGCPPGMLLWFAPDAASRPLCERMLELRGDAPSPLLPAAGTPPEPFPGAAAPASEAVSAPAAAADPAAPSIAAVAASPPADGGAVEAASSSSAAPPSGAAAVQEGVRQGPRDRPAEADEAAVPADADAPAPTPALGMPLPALSRTGARPGSGSLAGSPIRPAPLSRPGSLLAGKTGEGAARPGLGGRPLPSLGGGLLAGRSRPSATPLFGSRVAPPITAATRAGATEPASTREDERRADAARRDPGAAGVDEREAVPSSIATPPSAEVGPWLATVPSPGGALAPGEAGALPSSEEAPVESTLELASSDLVPSEPPAGPPSPSEREPGETHAGARPPPVTPARGFEVPGTRIGVAPPHPHPPPLPLRPAGGQADPGSEARARGDSGLRGLPAAPGLRPALGGLLGAAGAVGRNPEGALARTTPPATPIGAPRATLLGRTPPSGLGTPQRAEGERSAQPDDAAEELSTLSGLTVEERPATAGAPPQMEQRSGGAFGSGDRDLDDRSGGADDTGGGSRRGAGEEDTDEPPEEPSLFAAALLASTAPPVAPRSPDLAGLDPWSLPSPSAAQDPPLDYAASPYMAGSQSARSTTPVALAAVPPPSPPPIAEPGSQMGGAGRTPLPAPLPAAAGEPMPDSPTQIKPRSGVTPPPMPTMAEAHDAGRAPPTQVSRALSATTPPSLARVGVAPSGRVIPGSPTNTWVALVTIVALAAAAAAGVLLGTVIP